MGYAEISLTALPIGQQARVVKVGTQGLTRNRLLDLGLVPSSLVKAVRKSPGGDPVAYKVRGAIIALRTEESRLITVWPLD
ncbi:MAG TPA: ferrous iron transport protein A [Firmicutes bacterium]|nr:ferrous iron transport protein A [Bacillota bacterium]